ncbi:MAG: MarR family winged helix-turn-helix transcriptional regulator [Devosiaceae bacterium]
MTKTIDPLLVEHLGIRLHRAYQAWLSAFVDEMNAAGHEWFTQARANLIGQLPRDGCKQAELLVKTGWTKQALQQMLDGLERQDVIARSVDPQDKRGRLVALTDKGRTALVDADRIKTKINTQYAAKMGAPALQQLEQMLDAMVDP